MAGIHGTRTYERSNWYNTQEFDNKGLWPPALHPSSMPHAYHLPILPARSVFSDTDTKCHARYKATMSLGYLCKDVPSLEKDIDEVILTFMDVLKRDYPRPRRRPASPISPS